MDQYRYPIIHIICLAGSLSDLYQPCSLGKAAGRDLAVAQGPRPCAARPTAS